MILEIFVLFFAVSFLLLFYGYYAKIDLPRLLGFLLLFIIGMAITPSMPGDITYKTGENISTYYKYGDNYSGYHWDYDSAVPSCNPSSLDCVNLFHTYDEKINTYSTFEDHTIGFYIMIISVLMFIMVMVERRDEKRRSRNED